MPSAEERRGLQLTDGVPVVVLVRTDYDTTGRPAGGLRHPQSSAGLRAGVRRFRLLISEDNNSVTVKHHRRLLDPKPCGVC